MSFLSSTTPSLSLSLKIFDCLRSVLWKLLILLYNMAGRTLVIELIIWSSNRLTVPVSLHFWLQMTCSLKLPLVPALVELAFAYSDFLFIFVLAKKAVRDSYGGKLEELLAGKRAFLTFSDLTWYPVWGKLWDWSGSGFVEKCLLKVRMKMNVDVQHWHVVALT